MTGGHSNPRRGAWAPGLSLEDGHRVDLRAELGELVAAGEGLRRMPRGRIVHVLSNGTAICGLDGTPDGWPWHEGVPADWPPGHRWVAVPEWPLVELEERCSACARALESRP